MYLLNVSSEKKNETKVSTERERHKENENKNPLDIKDPTEQKNMEHFVSDKVWYERKIYVKQ